MLLDMGPWTERRPLGGKETSTFGESGGHFRCEKPRTGELRKFLAVKSWHTLGDAEKSCGRQRTSHLSRIMTLLLCNRAKDNNRFKWEPSSQIMGLTGS